MTPPTAHRTAVVAIGGNALLRGGARATIAEQFDAARQLAAPLAALATGGQRVVVTHGNGPQVGFIKRRSDLVAPLAPELPSLDLDMCVADSQGSIGYILASTLGELLPGRVAALVTHTVVAADDPAFARPTKPIGSFLTESAARALAAEHGWRVAEDAGRGWRRVVPSPRPVRVLETEAVRSLAADGFTVIAGGGGGIPLRETPGGGFRGVEAVIDKDLTSAHLAGALDAKLLVITTGADRVAVDYGRPGQRFLDHIGADEAELLLAQGQFPEGSMGPKIRAALEFLAGGPGRVVLITSPDRLAAALDGAGGTRITATTASATATASPTAAPASAPTPAPTVAPT
ncbi:carbamate kinase [Streptomyces longispororuber]|uniref:carbamate kinase n=1 Tax=Streptomyces longispororuber TaxID=68230 RepID=UPI00210E4B74|nr:carbamate kinase [Streptomyces longispororuber]MCQ4207439.1 carbamate kinase [Streptomyces longispororuber]